MSVPTKRSVFLVTGSEAEWIFCEMMEMVAVAGKTLSKQSSSLSSSGSPLLEALHINLYTAMIVNEYYSSWQRK